MGRRIESIMPLHRFEEFGQLTDRELAAVRALGDTPYRIDRHRSIRSEGEIVTGFYLLIDGWAAASVTLPDGGRQIMKIHLPGDVLGSPSMCSDRAMESLDALTPVTVSAVPLERFGRLFDDHPRVASYFLLSVQRERGALMDQLASIGRTSAEACVAALLLDLADRLTPLGAVSADGFDLLITQEEMGDVLGLTAVHVNRTLRALSEAKLIERDRQKLTILDERGLARLAARPSRSRSYNLKWLPKSRWLPSN